MKSESEVAQSPPTLSKPMDCSPPGSSVPGIFQARGLEWGAIAFSGIMAEDIHLQLSVLTYICTVPEEIPKGGVAGWPVKCMFNSIINC